jgi:hypothetical protein
MSQVGKSIIGLFFIRLFVFARVSIEIAEWQGGPSDNLCSKSRFFRVFVFGKTRSTKRAAIRFIGSTRYLHYAACCLFSSSKSCLLSFVRKEQIRF